MMDHRVAARRSHPLMIPRTAWPIVISTLAALLGAADPPRRAADPLPLNVWHTELSVYPESAELSGPDASQQLAIDFRSHDVTEQAKFRSTNPAVAKVDGSGMIEAVSDGEAKIVIEHAGRTAEALVKVQGVKHPRPLNFANDIVPIFTKLGCNSGGCHGKSGGQNGFRLSLLGFEPSLDFETLTREDRGRRLFFAAPEQSLLLLKATAKVPHGGGKKFTADSHEFRLIARWIRSGAPLGSPTDPKVESIEIRPEARVLGRNAAQQIVVTAVFSDGKREDVTRWAQYQSNDIEVATVADGGRVQTRDYAGQAAIMARYQGQVAVFRAKAPVGKPITEDVAFPIETLVDQHALTHWKSLGLVPSEQCTDAEFIRRASLDITGTTPSAQEVRDFVDQTDPDKRGMLVDRLLERPEYSAYFAIKWADILRNKREGNPQFQSGTYRFYDWIRNSLAENLPYDRFVRSILAAGGTPESTPPVMWYRRLRTPDAFVDDTAQVFLGMRLQCAKCHHHPFERWGQDDYYGFAAFFARVGRKSTLLAQGGNRVEEAIFNSRQGSVTHPKTGKVMAPKGLGDKEIAVSAIQDPRQKLVDWLADAKNPYFAKAVVNRYWAHFMGRGITEPLDDMRVTNPPSNPELLDALAADFVAHHYDLKHLIRTIAKSRVYGLSSVPNDYNAKDRQSFARHYPKRMSAEVLLDAISFLTEVPTNYPGMPLGARAIELPDESVPSTFLDAFGRPKRDTPCECERVSEAGLGQSLMLLNSNDVQAKLTAQGSRAEKLLADPRPDTEKVADLFWTALGRAPSSGELERAAEHLKKHEKQKRQAYEDIIWALINTKEFQFID